MYIVKSGNGYVFDSESLLMTTEIEEAKRMGHGDASNVISRMEDAGFFAKAVRIADSVVRLGPSCVEVTFNMSA